MDYTYYVYILECSDKSYYTGVTNNIDRRLGEHNAGEDESSYTFKRRPVVLKYCEQFNDIKQAIELEKQIKGWSRKKKEALMQEKWEELIKLSKNYTQFGKPE